MYAIVEIGGHQYKVAENDVLFVDKQNEDSDSVTFDNVLLLKDDKGAVKVGTPVVKGASVTATILDTVKSDKVLVFKKKRRKGYQKLNGHRQVMSQIQIEAISASGSTKKAASIKAETKAEKTTSKAAPKKAASKKTETKKTETKAKQATSDLSSHTVVELKKMASDKGLTGYSSMKKAELIKALS